MKLKEAIRYTYQTLLSVSLVYYIFIFMIRISGIFTEMPLLPEIGKLRAVFVFVAILAVFQSIFPFLLQNGCSRQTVHKAMLSLLPLTLLFPAVDTLLLFGSDFFRTMRLLKAKQIAISGETVLQNMPNEISAKAFFTDVFVLALVLALGYFVSILFYRLKTLPRILVLVGVPALWMLLVSASRWARDAAQTSFLYRSSVCVEDFLYGFFLGTPPISLWVAFTVLSILCFSFAHLLIRKAGVRK